jgi:hypothetical protein
LALDITGKIVVVECKRDRTPRDVIAQILDYGSWVNGLTERELDQIALDKKGKHLSELFQERFGVPPPETINSGHSLVIVSSEFDASSRRIVEYLAEVHGVAINTVFFTTFQHDAQTLISTEWLMDQEEVAQRAESKVRAPWSGLWYVNVGQGEHRSWEDMRRYQFVAAGHGRKYSNALRKLGIGDPFVAYQKQSGYVGYGVVTSLVVPVREFEVDGTPLLSLPLNQPGLGLDSENPDLSEYVVGVEWRKAVPIDQAKIQQGIFANQNIVCELRDPNTVEFLRREFEIPAKSAT